MIKCVVSWTTWSALWDDLLYRTTRKASSGFIWGTRRIKLDCHSHERRGTHINLRNKCYATNFDFGFMIFTHAIVHFAATTQRFTKRYQHQKQTKLQMWTWCVSFLKWNKPVFDWMNARSFLNQRVFGVQLACIPSRLNDPSLVELLELDEEVWNLQYRFLKVNCCKMRFVDCSHDEAQYFLWACAAIADGSTQHSS